MSSGSTDGLAVSSLSFSSLALGVVYQLIATVLFVVAGPYVIYRTLRYPTEMCERMGWGTAASRDDRSWWVHGASLGELQGLAGFLEHARIGPEQAIVTVLSVSARKQVGARLPGYRAIHAPLDLWFCLLPFFLLQRPRALIVLETEIWPGWLTAAAIARIPVAVVSGRISDRNWVRIGRWKALYRPFCRTLAAVGAQTATDAERWHSLGARNVAVTGNLKYRTPSSATRPGVRDDRSSTSSSATPPGVRDDRSSTSSSATPPGLRDDRSSTSPSATPPGVVRSDGSGSPSSATQGTTHLPTGARVPNGVDPEAARRWIFVAGSLRQGEEEVLNAAREMLQSPSLESERVDSQGGESQRHDSRSTESQNFDSRITQSRNLDSRIDVVLAPRHPKETAYWLGACASAGVPVVLRSELVEPIAQLAERGWNPEQGLARALLIDRHGELGAWYDLASAAFVGGTLDGRGGHSLFEPAAAGCPTAFGPSVGNVRDVAEALRESGGGVLIRSARELADWTLSLRRDEARRVAQSDAALRTAQELATSGPRTIQYLAEMGLELTAERGTD